LAFTASLALAQVFDIGSPVQNLIYGQTVQLSATVRDPSGNVMNVPFQWISSNPSVISVDSKGNITGLALGIAEIDVCSSVTGGCPPTPGANWGKLEFQVLPSSIQISPGTQTIFVGDTIQFTGQAFDINGAPIPNPPFSWQVTSEDGNCFTPPNCTPAAQIDSTGLFKAVSTGLVTVDGFIPYVPREGKLARYEAFVPVQINLRPSYHLTRLLANDAPRNSFALRASPGAFAANDAGDIAFTASLDALSTGAFLESGSALTLLTNTGAPSPFPEGVISGIQSLSMNPASQVLVTIPLNPGRIDGAALVGNTSQSSYVLLEGTNPSPSQQDIRYLTITPNSFNSSGNFVYFALYTDSNGVDHNALFRFGSTGSSLVWSSEKDLPGVPNPINFVRDAPPVPSWNGPTGMGMDDSSTVYFMAQTDGDSSHRTLFRAPADGSTPNKVLAYSDDFLKSKVKVITDLDVLPTGDLVMRVDLTNGEQHVIRFSGSKIDDVPVRLSPLFKVFGGSTGGSIVFLGNPATGGKGDGLYRWKNGTATQVLALNGPGPNGETILSVEGAVVTSDDTVYAVVRTSASDFTVLKVGAANPVLVRSGTAFQGAVNQFFRDVLNGRRTGSPYILTGNPSSIFELQGSTLVARAALGDPLPGGHRFDGLSTVVEDPFGGVEFGAAGGVYQYANGQIKFLLAENTKAPDGTPLLQPKPWAVNGTGSVVVEANTASSQSRLFTLNAGKLTQLLTYGSKSPFDNGTVSGWTEVAIDNRGRVMVYVQVSGGSSGYFLFTNGTVQAAALLGSVSISGMPIAAIGGVRAAGNDFYALFSRVAFGDSSVVRFTSPGNWTPLVNTGDPVLNVSFLSYIDSFDVNSSGTVVFTAFVQGTGSRIIAIPSASGPKVVYLNSAPTDDGDYLLRFSDVNIREDSRVYFLGYDPSDRALIYQASPL
jgi:hypothetical protein